MDREYNVRLRIGLIFAILATSAVGKNALSLLPRAMYLVYVEVS